MDPALIAWIFLDMCFLCELYALTFFNVPVINSFYKDAITANALSIPVYFCAFVMTFIVAYLADRHQQYCLYLVISGLTATIGLMLLGIALRGTSFGFKYAGLCIATAGSISALPNIYAWLTSGLHGSTKTATSIAFVISIANVAGVIGPTVLTASQTGTGSYSDGTFGLMSFIFIGTILAIFIQMVWPFEKHVKEAEAQDLNYGYGKTLRNLATRISQIGTGPKETNN